ncbi:MAG: 50S ribosomal protein L15 [Clostridiales bacterium]|nr:50S ribosomal protein L15 [Clostridiales bacterium]
MVTGLHDLGLPVPRRRRKRVGRGPGSGRGKTSGRGTKGQGARSGGTKGAPFEGGQSPFISRVPIRGFNNKKFAKEYAIVNVGDLARVEGDVVTPETLVAAGLVKKMKDGIKILGDGEVHRAFVVKAHRFSKEAQRKIEAAGGRIEVI